MELAIALESRKQIVLVRESRENMYFKDEEGAHQAALASVAEIRQECPGPMRRVFDQCVILEVRDYRDVSQRQQLVEHLVSGKYARTLHVNPGELTPWTKRRDKRKAEQAAAAKVAPVAAGDG